MGGQDQSRANLVTVQPGELVSRTLGGFLTQLSSAAPTTEATTTTTEATTVLTTVSADVSTTVAQ